MPEYELPTAHLTPGPVRVHSYRYDALLRLRVVRLEDPDGTLFDLFPIDLGNDENDNLILMRRDV